jgi:hypothetical protein
MSHLLYEDAPHYLYRLHRQEGIEVPFRSGLKPRTVIKNNFISIEVIDSNTVLIVFEINYSWDGASGAINTKSWIIPSLVHDGFYQLMREGMLDRSLRKEADLAMYYFLKKTMIKGNYFSKKWGAARAKYSYEVVRQFGGRHTKPRSKEIKNAKI